MHTHSHRHAVHLCVYRYYVAPTIGLMQLEQNWVDPIPNRSSTVATLKRFQSMAEACTRDQLRSNWRLLMYLQRAYYDAFIATRFGQWHAKWRVQCNIIFY